MKVTTEERKSIRQYLLGNAPEAELPELEGRILSDDSFYEELLIAEDELIDQYLLGTLSQPERSGFVSHFLITDERQEKLRFSQSLRKYIDAETAENSEAAELAPQSAAPTRRNWFFSLFPVPGHPALRLSLAAISLLVVLGISWMVIPNLPWPGYSDKPHSVFVATLSPGLTRDGSGATRISIPTDKDTVRLQLQLELSSHGYQTYSAELRTSENSTLLSRDKLQSEAQGAYRVVAFDVPAQFLKVGDYQVRLSGVGESGATELVARYPFRVVN